MDVFYYDFNDVVDKCYDGLIVIGVFLVLFDYEDVNYWDIMKIILEWVNCNV